MMSYLKKYLFLLAIFLSSVCSATEVSFEEDHRLPLVYLNVAVKAGSVTDPQGQSGMSNFMGELMLRGTKSRNKEELDRALDQLGARLEVETRAEALIFRGSVLSSQLGPFLNLVKEVITEPSFPDDEAKKLKSEVISVLQEELGHDSTLASRKFTQFLFREHPYGKPVLGKVKDVQNLTRDQTLEHYRRLFQEQTLLVVGSGDASSSQISDWSKLLIPPGDHPAPFKTVEAPKNPDKKRLLIVDKPERTQTQINFGQIGIKMTDSDYFPLYLGNYAFGGGSFSAILMTEIRVKRGWSYGANSIFRFGLQPRSWQVHLFPAAKDTPNALAFSLQLVENLQNQGLTLDQFEFAKRSLINSAGFMYNTPKKRVENKLLERTLNLPEGFMKSYAGELKSISHSQVNDALKEFLKPNQTSIAVLGTAKTLKAPLAKAAGIPEKEVEVISYTSED